MKTTDRFLGAIVIGIVLLIAVAFAVVSRRPEPAYRTGDQPEDVAHNYLLALQLEDYERAYGLLSPGLPAYPATLEEFFDDLEVDAWRFRQRDSASLAVQSSRIVGDRAIVEVRETVFFGGGLFETSQRFELFELQLARIGGAWKITGGDYYISYCWTAPDACPLR